MKCNEFKILTDDYIEGTLPSGQKEVFESHMQDCSACKKEYEETVKLLEMVNTLPAEVTPSHDLWSNIESRISKDRSKADKIKELTALNDNYENGDSDKKNRYLKYAAISLIAAMILVALLPSLFLDKDTPILDKVMTPYWKVTSVKGTTIVSSNIMGSVDSLKPGDWLETKDSSQAILDVPGLGKVTIEPNTKIQLVRSDTSEHRIALEYGTINADINSKPRTFFVDSKSATAIDLGCSYTYTVKQNGDGVLYVKEGTVALESHGRESIVPSGKYCLAKTGIGPGTPFRENSSASLKEALMKYDFEKGGEKEVDIILKNSKKGDVVTLMNLMPRVDDRSRTKVYRVITNYTPAPKNVVRDSIPRLNARELNEWIQEFQAELKKEMKENMEQLKEDLKKMNKDLKENLSKLPKGEYNFDDEKFNEELKQKIQKNLDLHLEKLENLNEMIIIPDELIEKTIEESLEKTSEELERNSEKIEREMERLQESMERMNERMQEKMERQNEREEQLQERAKEREERMKEKQEKHNKKYKGYWKDGDFHFEEVPEENETPETPEINNESKEENVSPETQPENVNPENEEKEFNYHNNIYKEKNQHSALTNTGRITIVLPPSRLTEDRF
jgi:hypothetical protein